jgi:hypothetical protein
VDVSLFACLPFFYCTVDLFGVSLRAIDASHITAGKPGKPFFNWRHSRKRNRIGKDKHMASEHTSVAISFRTDPAMHANLTELAYREGVTVSTLCRRLLEKVLKQHAQGVTLDRVAGIRQRARQRIVSHW